MLRKSIPVLLTFVMVFGMVVSLPFTVYAETTELALTASQQDDIVNIAKSQLGVQERSSGSDNVIYNDWYYGHSVNNYDIAGYVYGVSNPTYPWCAAFVSWCAEQAGVSKSVIPKDARTNYLWNNIDGEQYLRTSGYTPHHGDIIFFGTNARDHIGIVDYTDGNTIYYIDGNNTQMEPHGVHYSSTTFSSSWFWGTVSPKYEKTNASEVPLDLGNKFVANLIKANDWSTIVNNNTNVEIQYGYGYANEYWLFNKCDDGSYTVKSLEDGKYLDVEEAGNRDGLNIHVYDYTGANNQKWFIKQSSYGKILVPQCALNSCLDVNNDGSANGTNVQLWSQNGTSAQGLNIYIQPEIPCFINLGNEFTANLIKANDWSTIVNKGTNVEIQYGYGNANEYWRFKREKDGSYIIKSLEDGKYLDVSEAGSSDGLNIHVFDYTGAKNQKWYITDGPFGKVLVPQCAVNSCLDVNNDGTANGTNVQLWTQNLSSAQGLNIYKQPDVPNFDNLGEIFTCKMRTVIDNRCIINNNTNAEIGESKNNINEYWIFERKNDGTYTIKSLSNGKYLDVDKNGNSDGLNIYTYEYTGANNQRWYIRKAGITYNLIPKCAPHSALDINENEYEVGTNIQLWSQNQSDAQRFSIYFATPNYLLGDVDGDGEVSIIDATNIQRYLASIPITFELSEKVADTDEDGEVAIIDVTFIQRWLVGISSNNNIGKPIS